MRKTKVSFERQINERVYQFLVPYEASFEETLWVLNDIKKSIEESFESAKKSQEKPEEGEVKDAE